MRLFSALALFLLVTTVHTEPATVTPGYQLRFPRDAGSHPDFRTEWWYVTGWLQDENGVQQGFQVTFFRSRNDTADANPSKFAPKQLLFAHAALSRPSNGRLLHAQRSARAGFGVAEAREQNTDVVIDDWFLRAEGPRFRTSIVAEDFAFALTLEPTQPPLLQGEQGFSRKGPNPASASYYYSLPHLRVQGAVMIDGRKSPVTGHAWFDHEWSSEYLDAAATGWDWIGINLNDGAALMAFRIRDDNGAPYWAGATLHTRSRTDRFAPESITWTALRTWRSPRTGIQYPVSWRVKVGTFEAILRPLMDDQESDARGSVGVLYWEGAVEATDSAGNVLGRGYLELTGYGQKLRM
jgi:predicted secreted hydrolase